MRDVVGYEGLYKVTSCGKVWSCRQKRFMKAYGSPDDYQMIGLVDADGKQHFDYIHRIVAKAYVPNPHNYNEVNHKDEIKSHNWANNLEWCTRQYNICYGTGLQRRRNTTGKTWRTAKKVLCIETGEIFRSVNEAARAFNVTQPNVSMACHGKLKTCGGYHFQFADK